jgi:hypothetical protein
LVTTRVKETAYSGERRGATRYIVRVPARLRTKDNLGTAIVFDISSSGARLEESSTPLIAGQRLTVSFSFFPDSTPVELSARVVRNNNESGCCISFERLEPRVRQILVQLLPKIALDRSDTKTTREFDGQLVIEIAPSLHAACVDAARRAGLGLNDWFSRELEGLLPPEVRRHVGREHNPDTCPDCIRKNRRAQG